MVIMTELTNAEKIDLIRVWSSVLSGLGSINQNDSNQEIITEIITTVKSQLDKLGLSSSN